MNVFKYMFLFLTPYFLTTVEFSFVYTIKYFFITITSRLTLRHA